MRSLQDRDNFSPSRMRGRDDYELRLGSENRDNVVLGEVFKEETIFDASSNAEVI